LAQVRRALRSLGLPAREHEPPRALAGQVRGRFGTAGDALAGLLLQIEQQRYGRQAQSRPMAALTGALQREARQLVRLAAPQSTG
jgi:hypothetical protein